MSEPQPWSASPGFAQQDHQQYLTQQHEGDTGLLGTPSTQQDNLVLESALARMSLGEHSLPSGGLNGNFGAPHFDQANGANSQQQPGEQSPQPQQNPGLPPLGGEFASPPFGGPNQNAALQAAIAARAAQNPALVQQMAHAATAPMNTMPGNTSAPRPSMEQLKQFMLTTRNDMKILETELASLPSRRGELSDAEINAHATTLRGQLLQKRAHLGKIASFLQATYGPGALGPNVSDTSASPRIQSQGPASGPSGPVWVGSPALSPDGTPFHGNVHLSPAFGRMQPQPGQSAPGSGIQPRPLDPIAMLLCPPNLLMAGMNPAARIANGVPIEAPGQSGMMTGTIGEQGTQGMQPQHPGNMVGLSRQLGMVLPPLDRSKFLLSFKNYLRSRSMTLDPRLMQIGDRQIDLYQLHAEVMRFGGFAVVEQRELWPVIGGKLGIVQFPANAGEPAKSAPQAASGIAHLYKEYLAGFEEIYCASASQARSAVAQRGMQGGPLGLIVNGGGHFRQPSAPELQKMLEFANLSRDEMRQRGMPDGLIAAVEAHRPTLLQLQGDSSFRQGLDIPIAGPAGVVLVQGSQPGLPIHSQDSVVMQPRISGANLPEDRRSGDARSPTPPTVGIPGTQGELQGATSPMTDVTGQPQPGQPAPGQPQPSQQSSQYQPLGTAKALAFSPPGVNTMLQNQAVQNYLNMYPQEQLQDLTNLVHSKKTIFHDARNDNALPLHNVTQEQRPEYDQLLERLWRLSNDLYRQLPIFLISVTDTNEQEGILRKFIPVIASIDHQRQLLVSGVNKFVLSMDIIQSMIIQMQSWHAGVLNHISQAIATKNAEQRRL